MRWVAIITVLIITTISARAIAAEPIASIPYRLDYNGWYTVDVSIDGQGPYQFVVDTGATLTALFENAATTQNFPAADVAEKRVLGIVGAQNLPAVILGDIEVGGVYLRDHIGVIIPDWDRDGPKPHGVLGLDFLSRFVVLFDAERQRMEFFQANNAPTERFSGMASTRLRYNTFNRDYGGLYTVMTNISNRRIPCIVDLGADGTMLNYRAMRRLMGGMYINPNRATGSTTGSKIRDVFGDEAVALTINAGPIRIGSARWKRRTLVVFNAGIFEALGVLRKGYCLLGADLLQNRNLIFDFGNEQLYISNKAVIGET